MEIYKFFNSTPGDPRTYQASDFADYFGSVLSTGLLHTNSVPGMAVSVVAGTLNTKVSAGKAIMRGHLYENTADLTLTHSIPEPTLDRIDRVVLRLDLRNSVLNIKLHVKEGVSAAAPVAPTLQRDNFIYEISLARVLVRKNTVQLLAGDLVDERLNEAVGGLVHSLISDGVSEVDFTAHKAEDAIHLAGGTANAITVSTGGNYSYGQFKQLKIKAIANSTGNVTINVDGLGVKPALKFDGTQLAAGAIKTGKVYDWYYDTASGGRFFLIAKASGNAVAGDVLAGKTFSNDDGEFVGLLQKGAVFKSVQRGYLGVTSNISTIPISPVDLTKSYVVISFLSTATPVHTALPSVRFSANNQLTVAKGRENTSSPVNISWEVVEFLDGVKVQSGVTQMSDAQTAINVTIETVNLAKSFLYFTQAGSEGSSGSFNQMCMGRLITSNRVDFTKNSSVPAISNIAWFVVEIL